MLFDLLLFGHIMAAIIWLGSGFLIQVLATRADRATDDQFLAKLLAHMGALGNTLFIPASLAVLALGIGMTIESPAWNFDQLWIILGLVGYAMTFIAGAGFLGPTGEKLGKAMAENRGHFTPETRTLARKLLAVSRIDFAVLVLVVVDMALKPTADDVGVLAGMALVLVGVSILVAMQIRALAAADADGRVPAAPAT